MDFKEILGHRIKSVRLQKNVTQDKAALSVGITNTSWRSYEKGRILPSLDMFVKIADYLEVSTDWLLGRDDRFVEIGVKVDSSLDYKGNKDFDS